MPDVPHPLHLVGGGRDDASSAERELSRLRAEIEARNRQETAVSELGQAALTGVDPYILLGQACALVELTLGVEHARSLEIGADGRVSLCSSIGSNPTFLHCQLDGEENESIALYVSVAGVPVTFSNLEQETRFKSNHLRNFHGVLSGAGVVIPTASGVFGVLLAYSSRERIFADYEVAFLQSAASLLGEAVQKARTEVALRKSESRLKQLIASTLDAVISIDRAGGVIEWNPQAEAIFGVRAREVIGRILPREIVGSQLADLFEQCDPSVKRRVETVGRDGRGAEFPVEIIIESV